MPPVRDAHFFEFGFCLLVILHQKLSWFSLFLFDASLFFLWMSSTLLLWVIHPLKRVGHQNGSTIMVCLRLSDMSQYNGPIIHDSNVYIICIPIFIYKNEIKCVHKNVVQFFFLLKLDIWSRKSLITDTTISSLCVLFISSFRALSSCINLATLLLNSLFWSSLCVPDVVLWIFGLAGTISITSPFVASGEMIIAS